MSYGVPRQVKTGGNEGIERTEMSACAEIGPPRSPRWPQGGNAFLPRSFVVADELAVPCYDDKWCDKGPVQGRVMSFMTAS